MYGFLRCKYLFLSQRYLVDEFFLLTTTYDFSDRLRSYELIAEEFQLSDEKLDTR